MTPFVNDPDFILYVGDAIEVLRDTPAESVHCCVTSPPYWGLRDYGTGTWEGGNDECDHIVYGGGPPESSTLDGAKERGRSDVTHSPCRKCGATRVDQQLGLEPTPDLYVANMVAVFREVRRVLRADGTLWLNIGDSYSGDKTAGRNDTERIGTPHPDALSSKNPVTASGSKYADGSIAQRKVIGSTPGLKPKDLVGIPWRLAFALQADGWYLRSDIIWAKPNPMPESVTDRPTKAHEYLFLLTKSPRYFYDSDAIREPHSPDGRLKTVHDHATPNSHENYDNVGNGNERWPNGGRNKRSVWEIATEAYPDAHFATFPQALVEPCVKAGTSERGCCPVCGAPKTVETTGWRPTCNHAALPAPCTVLDPFMGSGTTAQVARRLGRKSIGIELNPEYAELCAKRLQQLSLFASDRAEA